ncbi:arabinan endo-1,5-alpha-L-arabinosidase [Sphingomonas sp. ABOLD]|uniref:arabinan endo-1,5-alpha-L-arabinosidase n=1 Tax=Sphingomonas sp. ABOLD TaxID=1985877 RepID=UPI000F7F3E3F|nr:arabinan endo-1,5-alpha-L-arabinosidase [Sphingomonas sp. ABOLD]RSV50394.1 arabinan endo-1,5-alpha-L-arabinosidase [Sphingomonas sp. ABOLD]
MKRAVSRVLALLAAAGGAAASAPRPVPLVLEGAVAGVHDPAILKDGDTYYLFATGHLGSAQGLLPLRTSTDLRHWTLRGASFPALPDWVHTAVPGATGIWAPDISKVGGEYRLYYAVSTFGKNRSAIGLATAARIDPAAPKANWVDRGPVVQSGPDDAFNAIDPMPFTDTQGRAWLVFGSFWSGIKLIRINPATGLRLVGDARPRALAGRPAPGAVEAPYVIRHGAHYYLFVSFDFCCRGAASSYRTVVGRSSAPDGPYVDRAGRPMLAGGGTAVLESGKGTRFVGRGGASILQRRGGDFIVYHAYDTQHGGTPTLQIQRLGWTADGWPVAR